MLGINLVARTFRQGLHKFKTHAHGGPCVRELDGEKLEANDEIWLGLASCNYYVPITMYVSTVR
jgi:hypothetical protein